MVGKVKVFLLQERPDNETVSDFIERLRQAQEAAPQWAICRIQFEVDYGYDDHPHVAMDMFYERGKTVIELEQDERDYRRTLRRQYDEFLALQAKFKDGPP